MRARALLIAAAMALALVMEPMAPAAARAETTFVRAAVAANAVGAIGEAAALYEAATGARVEVVAGSTGKLYAQITQGAPFDLFFAADAVATLRLDNAGLVEPGGRFVYARGLLAVWAPRQGLGLGASGLAALAGPAVARVAVANPATAPYGAAAVEALRRAGLLAAVEGKLVYGESVAQAFAFASSGNADAAIVAASVLTGVAGESALVDSALYEPIVQEVAVIQGAPAAARAFAEFVARGEGRRILERYGYEVD